MCILHAAWIGHRPWQHIAILPFGSRQYRLFFWVVKELSEALISFFKWKTKQEEKKEKEARWCSGNACCFWCFFLLFSCSIVTASGYTGFCQVCAGFHGSCFSSFQSNLEACHSPLKGNGSSQMLPHTLLHSLANSKPPFLTLLQGPPCCQYLPVTFTE